MRRNFVLSGHRLRHQDGVAFRLAEVLFALRHRRRVDVGGEMKKNCILPGIIGSEENGEEVIDLVISSDFRFHGVPPSSTRLSHSS